MKAQFEPIYPTSALLKDHIYCYYTVNSTSAGFSSVHYSFPHTYNAVSIYKGASFSITNGNLKVTGDGGISAPFCILQGKRQHPLLVDLEGAFSRLTILFKPLGLNHFIGHPLADIMGTEPGLFTEWDSPQFTNTLTNLFTDDPARQITQLESFLCNVYRPFNQPALQQALMLLSDFEKEKSVEEIAAMVSLPLRSFNRLFKTHLGVSPITHQRIARFRHSLENKLFHDKFKTLTDIGYQSNFYDQSYFIKLYNQLAGSNPGALFGKLEQLGNSNLVFEFKT